MGLTREQGLQALLAGAAGFSGKPGAQVEADAAAKRQQALKGYLKPDGSYQQGAEAAAESAASSANADRAQNFVDDNAAKGRKVSASFGGNGAVALSQQEQNPFLQNSKMEAQQGQKLYGAAQNAVKPVEGQLQAMSMMHQLLDNPNSVDQKQMGALQARLTEGQGQRLLQSLVETLGAPKSVSGDATKASNYLFGQAQSGFTADQSNALRQNLFKHQSEVEQQYNDGKQQFMQSASLIAPNLGPDKQMQAIGAAGLHSEGLLQSLHQRQQAFQKQGGAQTPAGQQPPQNAQPQGMIDQGASKLGQFFSGLTGGKTQQAPQPSPQQAPGGGDEQAQFIQKYMAAKKAAAGGQ